jgi:hypothetical protein
VRPGASIGIGVPCDFCEIAVHQPGVTQAIGQVKTDRDEPQALADSLGLDDWVALRADWQRLADRRDPRHGSRRG